jgi:DNA-binding LacI/PurR family transcriptional regulator
LKLPQKSSLIVETASVLRDGIRTGQWTRTLPSERALSEQLHISRPTLRLAISVLAREDLVRVAHGNPSLVLARSRPIRSQRGARMAVGLIVNVSIHRLPTMVLHVLMELRDALQQAGVGSEIYFSSIKEGEQRWQALEEFLRTRAVFCSLLVGASEELQQWFARNIRHPAFVMGSSARAVELPSLDVDYFSVCRHAAGMFLSRGHRRVAFIRPDLKLAGYAACEEGFLHGFENTPHEDAEGIVVRYRENPHDMLQHLRHLFRAGGQSPTGIMVAMPIDVVLAQQFLLQRGLRIPRDVSIIACNSDYYFDLIDPKITHYIYPERKFSQRLTRYLLQLMQNGSIPPVRHLILPDFYDGASLGPVTIAARNPKPRAAVASNTGRRS